jgi:hypothetical protein
MDEREKLHRLLYRALLEVRIEAHDVQNSKIFHLADLFHNIPLQLESAARGEGSYGGILSALENRAQEKGCAEWLRAAGEDEFN